MTKSTNCAALRHAKNVEPAGTRILGHSTAQGGHIDATCSLRWCIGAELLSKYDDFSSLFSFLVDFDRSYLRQFEAYEDSDSTFLCAARQYKSDGTFRFFIRYREGVEVV